MNLERTMKLGQLAQAEKDAREFAISIDGLKREMRLYLIDNAKPADLNAERVHQLSEHLVKAHGHYAQALDCIAKLREELGLPRYEDR